MNKIVIKILSLLLLFSVSISFQSKAEEVKSTNVKKVALNAFSYYSGKMSNEVKILQEIPVKHLDTTLLYVYNFETGFIIISADDIAEPVLGFGLDSRIDFDDMPPALNYLLGCYQEEILYAKRKKIKTSQEINAKWEEYLNPNLSKVFYMPTTWLVETKWGQNGGHASGSNVGYNYYCPELQGQKTLVGCGGVALAQVLNYWSCRVHPQGIINYTPPGLSLININLANQSYSWDNMAYNQANTSNALFLYHCAAAIESEFGVNGTTSYPAKIPNKLNQNFGFGASSLNHKNSYSDQNWIALLKTNIDNRRPIIYTGQKTNNGGGHGWVVDGYDSNNLFHCNWGWRGSSDGWFNLTNLTGNVAYTEKQNAIVNIYPTYYPGTTLQNITLTSNTYTGITITVDNCSVQNNANVILKANCSTEIFGPFTVPLGATLEIK